MLNTATDTSTVLYLFLGKREKKSIDTATCLSLERHASASKGTLGWKPARYYRTIKSDFTTLFFHNYLLIHLFTPSLMRNKQWQKENIYFFKCVLSSLKDIVLFCHSGTEKEWDSECNSKERCVSKCVFVCMCVRGSLEFIYEVCRSNCGTF